MKMIFKDKQGGLVVDYIGIANELKQALKTYTDAKGKGEPTLRAEEAYAILAEKMDAIRGIFAKTHEQAGLDVSAYETKAQTLLISAANYVLSLKDGKKRFLDLVLAMNKAFSLCSTLDEAKNLHKEIAFYSAIKAVISKHTSVDRKLSQAEKDSTLKQILDNAVLAHGVSDVFALCGLDKSTTVDWQVRDSVHAQLKILVRRTLQRWKYPPDKAAEAIELVMKQAELLSNSWSN